MGYVVTSVRVKEDLLREAKRRGIKISKILERALEEELRKIRLERAKAAARDAAEILRKINVEEVVRMVREDRER
ncbi:MAG: type II toxin-antitoxin system CcdA family antitoxin [Candidatus Diapherotrites archaeon]|nr:type II toxin-antitoxin system CcdA family antitoxin [Candidatus Diapherotrites archaeon]